MSPLCGLTGAVVLKVTLLGVLQYKLPLPSVINVWPAFPSVLGYAKFDKITLPLPSGDIIILPSIFVPAIV